MTLPARSTPGITRAAVDAPILLALSCEAVPSTPVWLMRQAGRYLPEYQAVRRLAGGFLAMATSPEMAAEVTLQPVRRFGVDAAVLFSDILLPLAAMGMDLVVEEGVGPRLLNPVRNPGDIQRLAVIDPEDRLAYVGTTLRAVRAELAPERVLFGFAGAPFTMAAYAVEGSNPGSAATLRRLMYREPAHFDRLMAKLTKVVSDHLVFQARSGADALVLFDTWAGQLSLEDYTRYVRPWTERVLTATAGLAPRLLFIRDGIHLLEDMVGLKPEGIALDWRIPIGPAFDKYCGHIALQGNLDPATLLASPEEVYQRTSDLLSEVGGRPGHILSLGHGVLKETDPASVAAFVAAARDFRASEEPVKDQASLER